VENPFVSPNLLDHLGASWVVIAILMFIFSQPGTSFAVLGGSEASVQEDQAHMQASLKNTHTNAYTVHELQLPTGTAVKEFAANGTVFGVSWKGKYPPDMQQILGSYFETYQQSLAAQNQNSRGRRPVHVETPGLIVRVSGHIGSFQGQAYVPDILPQGMKAEDIR
jgi:hypothetical protein